MSLYNMLFGENPFSRILLGVLGLTENDVPRYRDCYLDEEGNIVIHTRTGGGNRDFYENEDRCRHECPEFFDGDDEPNGPWNDDLRKVPGYKFDADDDFDCTYANFHFEVPKEWAALVAQLKELTNGAKPPSEKWQQLFADLSSNKDTPAIKRGMEVVGPLINQISGQLPEESK